MSYMARKDKRKLFLFGKYSLALLPPKKWLNELGIKKGDTVGLEFDRTRKRIVIRLGDTVEKDEAPEIAKEEISHKESEDISEDWQSIPEIK